MEPVNSANYVYYTLLYKMLHMMFRVCPRSTISRGPAAAKDLCCPDERRRRRPDVAPTLGGGTWATGGALRRARRAEACAVPCPVPHAASACAT